MIRRIGVLCQDPNSYGFLEGLKRRLKCDAELVRPTTAALSMNTTMTRRQAQLATAIFRKEGVDLILRFTDADRNRWQDIQRHELKVFPDEVSEILVCGVAVENVEQWLALDPAYISEALSIDNLAAIPADQKTAVIKKAIARQRHPDEPVHEVTARLVANAPTEVFQRWLKSDDALRVFYQDCRRVAASVNCTVPNELGGDEE